MPATSTIAAGLPARACVSQCPKARLNHTVACAGSMATPWPYIWKVPMKYSASILPCSASGSIRRTAVLKSCFSKAAMPSSSSPARAASDQAATVAMTVASNI